MWGLVRLMLAVFSVCVLSTEGYPSGSESDEIHDRVKRIISGSDSDHSLTPYMVSLQAKIVTQRFLGIPLTYRRVYCGGTLIADRWVLTAAHCFRNGAGTPSEWHARFGSPNVERSGEETFFHVFGKVFGILDWQQMEYHPVQITLHPQYVDGGSFDNDIALVKLRETIPLSVSERVGLIDLARSVDSIRPQTCSVYGWGCSSIGSSVQSTMQKGSLPLVSDDSCRRIWQIRNMDKRVCAGGGGLGSACHGDSGGPLVCQTTNGTSKQVGVISFINGDSPSEYPVVLTEVAAYTDWINGYIG